MTERQRERLESESFRTLVQKIRYEDLPKAHKDLADAIGVEDTLKLCELVGGHGQYIPNHDVLVRQERDKRILRDSRKGMTGAQLAKKHQLTDARIRQILRKAEADEKLSKPPYPRLRLHEPSDIMTLSQQRGCHHGEITASA